MLDRIEVLKLAMAWATVHERPMTMSALTQHLTNFAMTVLKAEATQQDHAHQEQREALSRSLNTSRGGMKL